MADIFLDSSTGNDADDGSTRALAKATLAAALTAAGAGGRVGVNSAHAETQASAMSLTSPGTAASPTQVLCIDWSSDTFASNAIATGATVTTTGANSITFAGFAYYYGITFDAGSSGSPSVSILTAVTTGWHRFEACGFILTAGTSSRVDIGASASTPTDQLVEFINCVVTFGHASQTIQPNCPFRWLNTASAVAGTVPTTLLTPLGGRQQSRPCYVAGVDLSALGSGNNLCNLGVNHADFVFENCKLGASVSLSTGTIAGQGGGTARIVNCDSGDTNYRYQRTNYQGTITQESTIVRTGGASDGTTPISRKMVSTANAKFYSPLFFDVVVWNESTSALSLAAEVVSDGVTFTDAELWMEVEALTNSGFPYSSFTNDRAATILTTPANQTSSSETWTTTGLSSPTKQKLEVSVTPAEKGWIRCRIYLAKASSTVYVCPLITGLGFTSGRQWQAAEAYVIEGAGGGGSSNAHGSLLRGLVD